MLHPLRHALTRSDGLAVCVIVDALMYACLFWRDYGDPAQMLIAHYISFMAISDLAALFLPASRRHWFHAFRVTSAVSLAMVVGALWAKDIGSDPAALYLMQLGLIGLRFVHALASVDPKKLVTGVRGLPAELHSLFRDGVRSERWALAYLAVAAVMFYFPQVAYWTHYNWGESRLDAILTGFQAQQGLNVAIKLCLFDMMVRAAGAKLAMRSVIATLFIVQWPAMPAMFYLAPIPLAHIGLELFELFLVWLAYRYWREQSRALPATN